MKSSTTRAFMAKKQSTFSAHVANKLFSTIARLRLLLVMFLTLTVSAEVWAETASITFSSKYTNNTTLDDTPITIVDGITVTFAKRNGGTGTQYYTNGTAVRWYGGGSLTITSTIGNITAISITYTQTANSVSATVGTYSLSNSIGTWNGDAANVKFNQSGTSGHCRISTIAVTYESSCDKIVTVQAGKPIQGASFQLDKTGEQECCDDLTVTVSDIVTPSGYQFSAITQTGINSGVTIDQTNKIVTYAQNTSGTSTINVTFEELPKYTVTWSVDGNTTTEEVYSGKKPTGAPTIDPNNLPCEGADKFVGWTTGEYKGNSAPGKLYPTADDIPAITGNTIFYAVFADYEQ